MKPFRTNLRLITKNYLCILHEYLPGFDSSSDYVMLSEMINIFIHKSSMKSFLNDIYVFYLKVT